MNLTLKQKSILERVLLNMRYDTSKTLSENHIKEQTVSKPKINLDVRDRVQKLTETELFSVASKWGWKEPDWIPVVYDNKKKNEIRIDDAKNFLNKIGWPKFGKPPYSNEREPISVTTKKINVNKSVNSTKDGSPYGKFDPKNEPGYSDCVNTYSETKFSNLPVNDYEFYKDVEEYCYYNYSKYYVDRTEPFKLDAHTVLMVASIGSLAFGPFGALLSGIFDAADVYLYLNEGDYESAGVGLVFGLIPAGILIEKIPIVENFTKGELKNFIKKLKKKNPLTKTERELNEQLHRHRVWLARQILRNSATSLTKIIFSKKAVGKRLIRLLLFLAKSGLISFKWSIYIGGTIGGFVSLYWLGKKLGVGLEYLDGVTPPPIEPEVKERLDKSDSTEVEKQVIELSPKINKETQEVIIDLINRSEVENLKVKVEMLKKVSELFGDELTDSKVESNDTLSTMNKKN
jgi:hypothetical protein